MFASSKAQNAAMKNDQLDHGLLLGTKILTMEGELPVEYLSAGDRVITRSGARKLVVVQSHVAKDLAVVRIMEGVLGKDRPEGDLIVTPDQPILIRDWRAKAMFGTAQAMIPAERLVDGEYIRHETLADARIFSLRFEEEVVIYAGALELSAAAETVTA